MSNRKRYRALLAAEKILVAPGVYDAFSAKLAAMAGFQCVVAGGNAGIGGLLAAPDMGQTNMRDMADLYSRICEAVDVPVTADADTGYGGVHNVRLAVRAFENAGVSALTINDQTFPNRCGYLEGKQLAPVEEMLAKIKSAVDARRDAQMVIVARTDAANVSGLDEALERCSLFLEAGADIAKPQCVDDAASIKRVVSELRCPYLATLSGAAGKHQLDIADLNELGAAGVSLPSLSIFGAMAGIRSALATLNSYNSLTAIKSGLPTLQEYYAVVGLDDYLARDSEYSRCAASIMSRRQR